MLNSQNLKTITDIRLNADTVIRLAQESKQPVGILKNNKLQAYLVDAQSFERIMEFIEDYEDHQIAKERSDASDFEDFPEFWK